MILLYKLGRKSTAFLGHMQINLHFFFIFNHFVNFWRFFEKFSK